MREWREHSGNLWRGLVREGYRSEVSRKYKDLIKDYLKDLGSHSVFHERKEKQNEVYGEELPSKNAIRESNADVRISTLSTHSAQFEDA